MKNKGFLIPLSYNSYLSWKSDKWTIFTVFAQYAADYLSFNFQPSKIKLKCIATLQACQNGSQSLKTDI